MLQKGSFSFRNDNIHCIHLGQGLFLRIERASFAIARVYFVDENCASVDIPEGLEIRDNTNNVPVQPLVGTQQFVLAWSDNYSILYRGQYVVDLNTQRQWSLWGSPDREIVTIDN